MFVCGISTDKNAKKKSVEVYIYSGHTMMRYQNKCNSYCEYINIIMIETYIQSLVDLQSTPCHQRRRPRKDCRDDLSAPAMINIVHVSVLRV